MRHTILHGREGPCCWAARTRPMPPGQCREAPALASGSPLPYSDLRRGGGIAEAEQESREPCLEREPLMAAMLIMAAPVAAQALLAVAHHRRLAGPRITSASLALLRLPFTRLPASSWWRRQSVI